MASNFTISAQHIRCSANHLLISTPTEASAISSPFFKSCYVGGCSTGRLKLSAVTGNQSPIHGHHNNSLLLKCGGLDTVGPTATVGQVTEVDKDTFWPIVKAAGDKIVVLDMYTQWCGPCKVMAPRFQQLSEKYLDVVFLKLDCNKENKDLAKELGIRVVPTFKILKDSKIVKEITGAKFDDLVLAIETVRSNKLES